MAGNDGEDTANGKKSSKYVYHTFHIHIDMQRVNGGRTMGDLNMYWSVKHT